MNDDEDNNDLSIGYDLNGPFDPKICFQHIAPQMQYSPMQYVNSHDPLDRVLEANDHTVEVNGDLIITDEDGTKTDVGAFMKSVGERLCVLQPNFEAHEQYPALKDAYDQYKMLEKLLLEGNKDETD